MKVQGKLEEKLNNTQYGFRGKRNTVKQLTKVTYDIANQFNMNRTTAAIFLDIEKAFDTVWHDNLIYKVYEAQQPIYITKIKASFLTKRTFQVKIENKFTTVKTITAGVPQG